MIYKGTKIFYDKDMGVYSVRENGRQIASFSLKECKKYIDINTDKPKLKKKSYIGYAHYWINKKTLVNTKHLGIKYFIYDNEKTAKITNRNDERKTIAKVRITIEEVL